MPTGNDTMNKPTLIFDSEATPYWSGRKAKPTDYREILADFDAIIHRQLVASLELKLSDIPDSPLPYTGVLPEMTGLRPLHELIDWLDCQLRPVTERTVEAPPEPPTPSSAEKYPANTLARALWEALEKERERAWKDWAVRMACWKETEAPHRDWAEAKAMIANARDLLDRASSREADYGGSHIWNYLPSEALGSAGRGGLSRLLRSLLPGMEYDFERIEKLVRLNPIAVSISTASSTKGYLAFIFDGDCAALECPAIGNALYFFHADWRSLALESKQELIRKMKAGDGRISRLIHGTGSDMASRVAQLVGTRDLFDAI